MKSSRTAPKARTKTKTKVRTKAKSTTAAKAKAPARAKKVKLLKASDLATAKQPLTSMSMRFATRANTQFVTGRREWLRYLDTGIAEASQGRVHITQSAASGAMVTETGWHYHTCEMQIGFITKGWIDLQYEDGTEIRLEAGDVMFVPGGVKHNELRTSDDISGYEITIPAGMGTVPCEAPKGWKPLKKAA